MAAPIYPIFLPLAGCPLRCVYCDQRSSSGQASRPEPEEVAGMLHEMLPARGEGEIAFYGGTFTMLPGGLREDYLSVAQTCLRAGRAAGIRVSTRPDALDEGVVDGLARCGVTTVEIGCQSFSPRVLAAAMRGHGPSEARGAVDRLRVRGLGVGLQLMPGLPGGDRAEAIASLETALALKPDFLRIYPTLVVRGTPLEGLFGGGQYRPWTVEEAVEVCADMALRCRRAGVPVIRLGLQGTPALSGGGVLVAGPYHPAFGQLVRSRLWRRALLRGAELTGSARVRVHPADLSDALGHRRDNRDVFLRRFAGGEIRADRNLSREHVAFAGRNYHFAELAH
ncbi:radical SAM protein [uncultured Desulfuromonas sp.]|uniref:elongator complex protein 3 n=1 Tax=uncultured Desulfuromonas sp. TaxID=181013 RepID=UPI0026068133|nr:radical SAM protein [uncultured Desulfuromonas sp.]